MAIQGLSALWLSQQAERYSNSAPIKAAQAAQDVRRQQEEYAREQQEAAQRIEILRSSQTIGRTIDTFA